MQAAFRWSIVASSIAIVAALPLLGSCDFVDAAAALAESEKHAGPIEAEIAQAVGKRPRVVSIDSPRILAVTVSFDDKDVPAMPVPAIEPIARAAIVREYKKDPDSLTISFGYHKWLK